jgi:hypothetical protein
MINLLVILMLLATEVAYAEDTPTEPSTYDTATEPKESQFDKHPECMNRGTDTSIRPCVVNDAGVLQHLRPPSQQLTPDSTIARPSSTPAVGNSAK